MKKDAKAHTMIGVLFILDKYINDVLGIIGLSSFGYGVWLYDSKLSLISVGIIIMFVAYKSAKA